MNSAAISSKDIHNLYDIEWNMGGKLRWKMPNE